MNFTFEGRISIGDALLDTAIQGFDFVELATGTFLYASTGQNGGLIAYRLVDGALAQVVDQELFSTSSAAAATGLVSCVSVGGDLQLIFGGSASADLVSYSISSSGQMNTLSQIGDILSGTMKISAVAAIETSNGTVLYVVDEGTDQLTAYMPDGAGGYTSQTAQGDSSNFAISGPAQLETVTVGGHDFLLATDHASEGVFSYQIDATTGVLQQKGYAGASGGLGVSAPTAVETVTAFGQTWVILGAAGSSSISVMQIDVTGELQPVDHMIDTLNTRFGGVQALGVAQSDDQVFVVAGGSDDGLSLFTLLPDGRLIHLQTIPHTTGAGLMNIETISATIVGGEIQIFVSSTTAEGVAQYSISLDELGDTIHDQSSGANVLNGTSGDDLITAGTGGTDTLNGGAGDDILVGGTADVVMWGGAGADRFVVHSGAYTTQIMDFVAGVDLIDLSDFTMLRSVGQLSVTTTSYGALITVQGAVIEVHAAGGGGLDLEDIFGAEFYWADHILVLIEAAGEVMIGTDGNDTLEGGDDNDTLVGGLGNDNLVGGAGDDSLQGDDGDDFAFGNDGNDLLEGGRGNDTLWGGAGNDIVYGGEGADLMGGGNGDDVLYGDDGEDEIWANGGNDLIYGGADNDLLGGGSGNDTMYGEAGDDQVWGGAGDDIVHGGAGNDTLGGREGNDQLYGGDGNDEIWTNEGNDLAYGGAGNDTLGGSDGHDRLYGDAGDDLLLGGSGNDWLYGGDDDDTLQGGNGDDFVFGNDGDDLLEGGNGHDTLWGGAGNDIVHGGAGDDLMGGANGDDELYGEDGEDEIWANGGADLIYGGADNDLLGGGSGNDIMYGEAGDDQVWGGAGDDLVYGGAGNDTLGGREGNDQLFGGDGNDEIWTNAGDDLAYGGAGNDTLGGSDGNDTLYGDGGEDFLIGGNGNDWLSGGADDDTLQGGAGADVFYFELNQGDDQISDFNTDQDSIHISGSSLSFSNLNLNQLGGDVVVALGSGQITLLDTVISDLSADDFVFL